MPRGIDDESTYSESSGRDMVERAERRVARLSES